MIAFACPECQAQIRSKAAIPGDQVQCNNCKQVVRVPYDGIEEIESPEQGSQTEGQTAGAISIYCPHCGKTGSVPEKAAGSQAKCPRCRKTFTVPQHPALAPDRCGRQPAVDAIQVLPLEEP